MSANMRHRVVLVVAACACIGAPLASSLGRGGPFALVAVVALFCTAPGSALLPLVGGSTELGLVVGTSLGVCALTAQGMLWADAWDPVYATYVVAGVCLPLIGLHLVRESRRLLTPLT